MNSRCVAIAVIFLAYCTPGAAAEKAAVESEPALPGAGKTIYMDVNLTGRTKRAAERMTELHRQHHALGWTVIDVDPYIENGDLEGFFITYVARDAANRGTTR